MDADAELVKEIQTLLKIGVDGIVGPQTMAAFTEFKLSVYLGYPEYLGVATTQALLEIAENHTVIPEQTQAPTHILVDAGTTTGRVMRLPTGGLAYQYQFIIPGIPLTWGEVTKNCSRVPESREVVGNIFRIAHGFGKIRDKYGSPLGVTSGYRPPVVNKAIGGAVRSQHIYGLALDLCPLDRNLQKLWEVCLASDAVGAGRGMPKGFVHCDWRSGQRVVFNY